MDGVHLVALASSLCHHIQSLLKKIQKFERDRRHIPSSDVRRDESRRARRPGATPARRAQARARRERRDRCRARLARYVYRAQNGRASGDILQRVLRPRRHAVSKRQRSLRARPTDSRDEA